MLGLGLSLTNFGTKGGISDAADGGGVPAWVQLAGGSAPVLDLDFLNNQAYFDGGETTPAALLTCTRTGATGTYINSAGLLTTVAANTLRIGDMGLTVEPAATNVVLWNRDLTNAAWTKTNATAAKDQAGIDGVSNAASSLTATAGNATCLQAITLASSARWQSAFVKRLTGAGTVEMTTDNGTTWTAVTVTASWARVEIPTQTLANPTVGFRIVTSGDAIAIDYVQNEASILTTPILTTTAAATRNADTVNVTDAASLLTGATALTVMAIGSNSTPAVGINQATFQIDNSSITASAIFMRQTNTSTSVFARDTASVVQMTDNFSGLSASNRYRRKHLFTMATNNATAAIEDGTTKVDTSCTLPVTNRISVGGQNGAQQWAGNIHRFTIWKTGLTTSQLQDLSAAQNDLTILAEGDSISTETYWVPRLRSIAPNKWQVHSVAVSNSSINNATGSLNINSTTRKNALHALRTRYATANSTKPVLTVIFTGHNEVATDGNSAATFITELQTYCAEMRAAGHLLCVVPVTPSTTAGVTAFRATVNAEIATWVGTYADYVVDWSAVSGMADGDASNVALWVDGIHPSAAQSLVMAQAMKTQVFDVVAAL